jgi:hypothetical protein
MAGESPLSMMRAERPLGPARATRHRPRRRLWPIVAVAAVIVLAAGWCGSWYFAAGIADRTLAGWVQREAAAGRVYSCGSQSISGFPFRIQAHCVTAGATLSGKPPLVVAAKQITFTAQVYRPTVLTGEVAGPLTVAEQGQSPGLVATWTLARIQVSGLPPFPDAVAVTLAQPHLGRLAGTDAATLFAAQGLDLQARIVGGSANDHPVIDAVLRFAAATAPNVHPLLVEPLQGEIEIVVRGFNDLSPKPMAERFREVQAGNGDIEVKSLRIERSDAIVVGNGTLTLNEHGRLDGMLRVAVAGLETIVPQLGLDRLIGRGIDRLTGTNGQPGQDFPSLTACCRG